VFYPIIRDIVVKIELFGVMIVPEQPDEAKTLG